MKKIIAFIIVSLLLILTTSVAFADGPPDWIPGPPDWEPPGWTWAWNPQDAMTFRIDRCWALDAEGNLFIDSDASGAGVVNDNHILMKCTGSLPDDSYHPSTPVVWTESYIDICGDYIWSVTFDLKIVITPGGKVIKTCSYTY